MTNFKQPMLASDYNVNQNYKLKVFLASEKLDGIRCVIQNAYCKKTDSDEKVFSRSGKRIPNHYIREVLGTLPAGLDGEIAPIESHLHDSNAFQQATSAAMTMKGEPTNWCYYVFDFFGRPDLIKRERIKLAQTLVADWQEFHPELAHFVKVLEYKELDIDDAIAWSQQIVEAGGEGVMVSNPLGEYVFRRARHTESLLLKLKPSQDDEAVIIGFQEAVYTGLTSVLKAMPEYSKLTPKQAKALLAKNADIKAYCESRIGEGKGELGSVQVKAKGWVESFSIGSGFSQAQRIDIWANKELYLDKTVRFKYIHAGTKDRPRMPVFQGFRAEDDMGFNKVQALRHEAALAKALQLSKKAVASIAKTEPKLEKVDNLLDVYYNRIKTSLSAKHPRRSTIKKWVDSGNGEDLTNAHINYWTEKGYGL